MAKCVSTCLTLPPTTTNLVERLASQVKGAGQRRRFKQATVIIHSSAGLPLSRRIYYLRLDQCQDSARVQLTRVRLSENAAQLQFLQDIAAHTRPIWHHCRPWYQGSPSPWGRWSTSRCSNPEHAISHKTMSSAAISMCFGYLRQAICPYWIASSPWATSFWSD